MKFNIISTLVVSLFLFSSFLADPKTSNEVQFFQGTFDDFLREARKQDKPVIIDFWAEWCGPCIKMDTETFKNASLATYVNANYLVYKVNIDTFDGMEIAEKYSVDAFPSMIVADKRGIDKGLLKGFYPAANLHSELKKIQAENNLYPALMKSEFAVNK